jgi:hypothetical protein
VPQPLCAPEQTPGLIEGVTLGLGSKHEWNIFYHVLQVKRGGKRFSLCVLQHGAEAAIEPAREVAHEGKKRAYKKVE